MSYPKIEEINRVRTVNSRKNNLQQAQELLLADCVRPTQPSIKGKVIDNTMNSVGLSNASLAVHLHGNQLVKFALISAKHVII